MGIERTTEPTTEVGRSSPEISRDPRQFRVLSRDLSKFYCREPYDINAWCRSTREAPVCVNGSLGSGLAKLSDTEGPNFCPNVPIL